MQEDLKSFDIRDLKSNGFCTKKLVEVFGLKNIIQWVPRYISVQDLLYLPLKELREAGLRATLLKDYETPASLKEAGYTNVQGITMID